MRHDNMFGGVYYGARLHILFSLPVVMVMPKSLPLFNWNSGRSEMSKAAKTSHSIGQVSRTCHVHGGKSLG